MPFLHCMKDVQVKAFINNIAVAQNTAHGASIGIQLDQDKFRKELFEKEGRAPTVEEQLTRLKTYTSELSASFVGEDGRVKCKHA